MITLMLSGGLGNQMFQYAAGLALAKRLNTSLAINLYSFNKKTKATKRQFELDVFNIREPQIVNSLKSKLVLKGLPYILKNKDFFSKFRIFVDEAAIKFDSRFFEIRNKNTTLLGYFQNESYFEGIESRLRFIFSFQQGLTDRNKELAKEIESSQSVSIHIRRGDYIGNKDASSGFITCNAAYYQNAIEYISKDVENPKFYIFSEDLDWAKENIDFGTFPHQYIDWNTGSDSYRDMQLMSLCKHNIIANSSFSWWAAWLNNNNDKIVAAPDQWFEREDMNLSLDSFYPQRWIRIK